MYDSNNADRDSMYGFMRVHDTVPVLVQVRLEWY